jgi:hypothetical protein
MCSFKKQMCTLRDLSETGLPESRATRVSLAPQHVMSFKNCKRHLPLSKQVKEYIVVVAQVRKSPGNVRQVLQGKLNRISQTCSAMLKKAQKSLLPLLSPCTDLIQNTHQTSMNCACP